MNWNDRILNNSKISLFLSLDNYLVVINLVSPAITIACKILYSKIPHQYCKLKMAVAESTWSQNLDIRGLVRQLDDFNDEPRRCASRRVKIRRIRTERAHAKIREQVAAVREERTCSEGAFSAAFFPFHAEARATKLRVRFAAARYEIRHSAAFRRARDSRLDFLIVPVMPVQRCEEGPRI